MVCAIALVAMAPVARADTLFDAFKSLCVDTHAARAGSLAAAEKIGWTPVPESLLSKLKPSGDVMAVDGRMTTTKEGLVVMVVGYGKSLGALKLQVDLCTLVATPGDGVSLKAAAAEFAAVDPDPFLNESGGVAYAWRDEPAGHKQVNVASLKFTPADPGVRAMMVGGDASKAMIVLVVPTSEP
jgi:hypothetical protein